jgi:glycosyltransferase involved in cell wall biosynthesis
MRLGYLIGQFPMPTHTFLWRDVLALERQGIEVDLVSTRLPTTALAPHRWAPEAMARTTYLCERPTALAAALARSAVRRPRAVARCLSTCREAEASGWRRRLEVAAMVPFGARTAGLARARGWSHLHVPFPAHAALVALFARLLGGPPYSLGHHGAPEQFGPDLSLALKWRHASLGRVVTDRLAVALRAAIGDDAPPTLLVTPMGADLAEFARAARYVPWPGRGPARLFSCGRGVPSKGHLDLVEATARLAAGGLEVELRIAGEFEPGGKYQARVLEAVRTQGLEGRVTLLGTVTEGEVRRELERCHAFVLATHDEGLGVSILEAMAMEVPVIASRVGGVPVLVDDGQQGLLVPPRDPPALAAAIAALLADPARALGMGQRGRAKAAAFAPDRGAATFAAELRRRQGAAHDPPAGSAEAGGAGHPARRHRTA